jgi:D-arginine dehydrogenase
VTGVNADFLIVGAGIAGASVGYWLAPHGRTVVLERERQPGYHSTGRSAAMVIDSYGPRQVRALTAASRTFFAQPPTEFADEPLLAPRSAMMVARPDQEALLDKHYDVVRSSTERAQRLSARGARTQVPVLRPEQVIGAVLDPTSSDVNVHALHQGYLRGIRQAGGHVYCNAEVLAVERDGRGWRVLTQRVTYRTAILINAAGAWCDKVARLAGARPIGLVPKRRSAFVFGSPPGSSVAGWPLCGALDETWYMKPEAGALLGSPANADPVEPHDVQAEDLDIAVGIHQIQEMTTLDIRRPSRIWTGLRSFVADDALVGGYDRDAGGFFWVAGQRGYGIQTSPAMGETFAALVRGQPIPGRIAEFGLTREMLGPARLVASRCVV